MKITLFGSKSCMPCKMISKMLTDKKIAFEYKDATVDLNEMQDNNISALPTLMVDGSRYEGFEAAKSFVMKNK